MPGVKYIAIAAMGDTSPEVEKRVHDFDKTGVPSAALVTVRALVLDDVMDTDWTIIRRSVFHKLLAAAIETGVRW